jgi:hypothetical protein
VCIRNQLTIYTPDFTWFQQAATLHVPENYLPPPVIATGDATGVTSTSAMLGGNIVFGASTSYSYSFYLSLTENLQYKIPVLSYDAVGPILSPKAIAISVPIGTLTPGTTYYFRLVVYDKLTGIYTYASYVHSFTTLAENEQPSAPSGINISSWADMAGDALFGGVTNPATGESTAHSAGGLFLSVLLIACVMLPLAYLGMPPLGVVGILIVIIGFTTAIGWMPAWIALVIGLGFSLVIARSMGGI